MLPNSLRQAIEEQVAAERLPLLTQAAAELSRKYREQVFPDQPFIATEAHRLAYAAVRMPATFAASSAALMEAARLAPELKIESLLDLGAGTGAASWAAAEAFDSLRQVSLIEQNRQLIELGRKLAQASKHDALRLADWRAANLRTLRELPPHDLVVCSYSLGEIETIAQLLNAAWPATQKLLVVIEPGTMKGFETVRAAREQLIEAGGFLIAPCPHPNTCPMTPSKNDWCHFAARFERSALHRRLKGGTLGYEDEKFSYVAFAKHDVQPARSRILRHPLRHAGYAQLQLCTADGLQSLTVTKRDKEAWRRARKADWGDAWGNGSTNNPAE